MSKNRPLRRRTAKGNFTFSISEASRIINVSRSTLRSWETMGLTRPVRTRSGYRKYTPEQVKRLKHIQRLRTQKNLNVAAIRDLVGDEPEINTRQPSTSATTDSIGNKLRQLRERCGLTITRVAEQTGLSTNYLSALETDRSALSVATLQRLSVLFKTNVLTFFSNSGESRKVVRSQTRQQISNEPGVQIDLLSSGSAVMEPHLFRLAPGVSSGEGYSHEGEEFVFVLEGCCEFWLDADEHYELRKGDSLYFCSSQQHYWKNTGVKEAVLFWINTPPTF
jgi:DNA-binding transcriptional MerR regulator/quercetin dioxygenase-like cupin family protein